MKNFSKIVNENKTAVSNSVLKDIEAYLKDKFSYGKPALINGPNYIHFSLIIEGGITPSELMNIIKKSIPEVQTYFKRVDDQGLDPLVCSNEYTKGNYGLRLSFGEGEILESLYKVIKFEI